MTTDNSCSAITADKKISIIGAGAMGIGIAQVAATAGHEVFLYDNANGAAETACSQLQERLNVRVQKNKMSQEDANHLCKKITPVKQLDDLKDSTLVIEAIIENLEIKQTLFKHLEAICSRETILASNTSSLSISAIASQLEYSERVVGMHFFNPAPVLKLVEVVSGLQTSENIAKIIFNTSVSWGKSPVYVKSSPGFIVNRVARPFYAEALRALNEATASVEDIDTIMRDAGGFKLGPLELTDLIGQDVNLAVTTSVYNAYYQDLRFQPSPVQAELVSAGLLGRKTGQGFYKYPNSSSSKTSPNVDKQTATEPLKCTFHGEHSSFNSLITLAKQSTMEVEVIQSSKEEIENAYIEVDNIRLQLTDGRLASECAQQLNMKDLVLFDLALNFETTKSVAITIAPQANANTIDTATNFWRALNKQAIVIKDVPGLLVMRTVAMLINEAADTVNQKVCTARDVDIAMCSGVAYPIGPFQWLEKIGINHVVKVLNNVNNIYGENRYRCSPLLQAAQFSGNTIENLT